MILMRRLLLVYVTVVGLVICMTALCCAQQEQAVPQKGLELQKAGKLEDAMKLYESILKSDPMNRKALFGLGTVYYSMGEYERAAATFQNVLTLNEGYTRARLYVALCKLQLGIPEEASNDLRRILIDHPENTTAMLALGVAEVSAGYPNTAIATFTKTLDLHPENAAFRETVRRMIRIASEQADATEKLQNLAVLNDFNNAISDAAVATQARRDATRREAAKNQSSVHRMAVMDAMAFFDGGEEGAERVRPDFLKK